jgi:heme/copper-type cytochrome/quinol oxidase subunit 2
MDYAIAIGIVSALLIVIITLIVFAALCRKKNKCKTNANSKDEDHFVLFPFAIVFFGLRFTEYDYFCGTFTLFL